MPFDQAHELPTSQVGESAKQLALLHRSHVNLPTSWIIPSQFLANLVGSQPLSLEIAEEFKKIDWKNWSAIEHLSDYLQKHIQDLRYPHQQAKALMQCYTQYWEQSALRFISSPTWPASPTVYHSFEWIRGEANVAHSILKIWSSFFTTENIIQLHQRWLHNPGEKLLPGMAIIVQHHEPAISSGWGYSFHPQTGDKRQLVIQSQWGETPAAWDETHSDTFVVDARTLITLHQDIRHKAQHLVAGTHLNLEPTSLTDANRPSLSSAELHELATIIQTSKRLFPFQLKLRWMKTATGLVITHLEPVLGEHSERVTHTTEHSTHLLPSTPKKELTGLAITTGSVTAHARVISQPEQYPELKAGEIIVVRELGAEAIHAIKKVAGVICERGVFSPTVLTLLKRYHVPCLIQVRNATSAIKNHHVITLDASSGKVLLQGSETSAVSLPQVKSAKTHMEGVQVLVSGGNPEKAPDYDALPHDGVGLLKSELTYAQLGIHPLWLIRHGKAGLIKASLGKVVAAHARSPQHLPILLRSCHLTSTELRYLTEGDHFEANEPNPLLGFRGALRIIHQPELFELELETLHEQAQQLQRDLGILVPYVRTPGELALIQRRFAERQTHYSHLKHPVQLWWQLSTPANVQSCAEYLRTPLSGVVVNLKTIIHLAQGVDSDNPDVTALYPLDVVLAEQYLTHIKQAATHIFTSTGRRLPVVLSIDEWSSELVTFAKKLQLDAVIVKPQVAKRAKQLIMEQSLWP